MSNMCGSIDNCCLMDAHSRQFRKCGRPVKMPQPRGSFRFPHNGENEFFLPRCTAMLFGLVVDRITGTVATTLKLG